ncbi:MAG: hypothetical protein C0618_07415 [Desulfuromonas sp.]|nr:MAG: hypothetical protein C0618_07415 [Desulfuromonas sp.]
MAETLSADPAELYALVRAEMPFGKYAGRLLIDLPEPYVVWLVRNRLPEGVLGRQLLAVYEIKVNGLEGLLAPLKAQVKR